MKAHRRRIPRLTWFKLAVCICLAAMAASPVHAVPRPDHTRPERGAGTGAAGFRNLSAPEIPRGTTRTGRTANNRCTIRLRKGTRG